MYRLLCLVRTFKSEINYPHVLVKISPRIGTFCKLFTEDVEFVLCLSWDVCGFSSNRARSNYMCNSYVKYLCFSRHHQFCLQYCQIFSTMQFVDSFVSIITLLIVHEEKKRRPCDYSISLIQWILLRDLVKSSLGPQF